MKNKINIPYILTESDQLSTQIEGATITWSSNNGMISADGKVINPPSRGIKDTTLTAKINFNNDQIIEREFYAKVIENSPNYILSYIRSGDNNLSNSMHLAYSQNGEKFDALNLNQGVLFAKADFTKDDPVQGTTKLLMDPYIFRMKDGSFGVVATNVTAKSSLLFFTSNDLLAYKEIGLISLNTEEQVNHPICEYDSFEARYSIRWENQDGKAYCNTTEDFQRVSRPIASEKLEQKIISTDIPDAIESNIIPITKEEGQLITTSLMQVFNTNTNKIEIRTPAGTPLTIDDLGKATLSYSDGSTADKIVHWNQEDLEKIDFDIEGTYTVNGSIKQTKYPFPMITRRADPDVTQYRGKYYFIATDENGHDQFYMRVADTILGLKDAKDHLILSKTEAGDMSGCLWAPELHHINGEFYIFFAGSTTGAWDAVQSRVMKLKKGEDPLLAASWEPPIRCVKKDGSMLYTEGITLDMTIFEDNNKYYVVWAQRYIGSRGHGSSDLYIGQVNPDQPWKLTSDPVLISEADYGWDRNDIEVDEGPYAIKHGDKLFISISGAMVNETYCVGLLTAQQGENLLDPSSWNKTNYPILTSKSVAKQYGPGHNTFTVDEDGNDVFIFHAKTSVEGSRDMGARRVHWGINGNPILDMTDEREIANKNVKAKILVK